MIDPDQLDEIEAALGRCEAQLGNIAWVTSVTLALVLASVVIAVYALVVR